jgi:hypothetical protein
MKRHLYKLEWSIDRRFYAERIVDLRERIKDREALMELSFDTVRIMLIKSKEQKKAAARRRLESRRRPRLSFP